MIKIYVVFSVNYVKTFFLWETDQNELSTVRSIISRPEILGTFVTFTSFDLLKRTLV